MANVDVILSDLEWRLLTAYLLFVELNGLKETAEHQRPFSSLSRAGKEVGTYHEQELSSLRFFWFVQMDEAIQQTRTIQCVRMGNASDTEARASDEETHPYTHVFSFAGMSMAIECYQYSFLPFSNLLG